MTHPAVSSLNPFISSDGGSRERPFVPADAAGGKSGTVTNIRANRKAEPGLEIGASQMPGSSMSFGLTKPIIAGQASRPSGAHFHPDMAALAVWLDEPPLFLRTRPTIRYADESRDLLAWFKVFFD